MHDVVLVSIISLSEQKGQYIWQRLEANDQRYSLSWEQKRTIYENMAKETNIHTARAPSCVLAT